MSELTKIDPITIETVDIALSDFFKFRVASRVKDHENKLKKVEVVWAAGERWKMIRNNKMRDEHGTLVLPLLSIARTLIDRSPQQRLPGIEVSEMVISKDLHPRTNVINNMIKVLKGGVLKEEEKRKIYEITTIPFPDFAVLHYEIIIWSQYEQHQNEMLEKFFDTLDLQQSFVISTEDPNFDRGNIQFSERKSPKGIWFVGYLDPSISNQSNTSEFSGQERILKHSFTITIPSYFILQPQGKEQFIRKNYSSYKTNFKIETIVNNQDKISEIFKL